MNGNILGMGMLIAATLVFASCERSVGPQRQRLAELRRAAPLGLGTFHGRVRVNDSKDPCHNAGSVAPGMLVEIGLWDGIPAFYRDTVTGQPPQTLEEPRFQLLGSTTTDREGRFTFADLPRGTGFAFRVVPPPNSRYVLRYGASLSGLSREGIINNHPALCVDLRRP